MAHPALDLGGIVAQLRDARAHWRTLQHRPKEPGGRELPSREVLTSVIDGLRGALFPMRLGPPDLRQDSEDWYVGHTLDTTLQTLLGQVRLELAHDHRQRGQVPSADELQDQAHFVITRFAQDLPTIRRLLDQDVLAAYRGDPAARSVDEILLCYPGIAAMIHHRLAHRLYQLGVPLLARLVAELAHGQTGIDIHPGAQIGAGCFIDHGTGVVIGETAVLGQRVRLYQAVTLGAKRFAVDSDGQLKKGEPRHPIVEDDVVIYAGATVLGRITIGRGSSIGGNVWLTHSVPPGSHITQASAQQSKEEGLHHEHRVV